MAEEDEIEEVLPAKKKRPDDQAFGPVPKQPRQDDEPRRRRDNDDFDDEPQPRRRPDEDEGDVTGGVIPYKNPAALFAYYLGVFGLIPILGCALAPLAIILGIAGIVKAGQHPKAKGRAHAMTGILLGAIGAPLLWIGIYFLFDFATKK
jgi:hypothetical protein